MAQKIGFKVWTRSYIESPGQMFPGPGDYLGVFLADNESDLERRLTQAGLDSAAHGWELAKQHEFCPHCAKKPQERIEERSTADGPVVEVWQHCHSCDWTLLERQLGANV